MTYEAGIDTNQRIDAGLQPQGPVNKNSESAYCRPGRLPAGHPVAHYQLEGGRVPGAARVAGHCARPERAQRGGNRAMGGRQEAVSQEAREEAQVILLQQRIR